MLWILLCTGIPPAEWKWNRIFPIPKPKLYNNELRNTRPIMLIDNIRKTFMKMLNARLVRVIKRYNILTGPNFAGLPGNSTTDPIMILKNIFERTRDHKLQCWCSSKIRKKPMTP